MHIEFWWKGHKERDYREELDLAWRIILKLILKRMEWYGLD
jgi:hypothetical protein